jgi:hypothetical protein
MANMLDVAIQRVDGSIAVDLGRRGAPPLPVAPALTAILPGGLRRGSTVSVNGSISLLLALLGAASAAGGWCALVGFPRLSIEAACEYGVDPSRLAVVPASDELSTGRTTGWTTAVGALLDAVDIVAARPPRLVPGDVRRLAARARTRNAVLLSFGDWPGADVRLQAADGVWTGIGAGTGRLHARRLDVRAEGRGSAARPRTARLWLPAAGGGVETAEPLIDVTTGPDLVELAG